jgi:hypothetical protein
VNGENVGHPLPRELGIPQEVGAVGESEQLSEVQDRARALLPADHYEMVLQAVEVGHEDDAGLVKAGGRAKDVA